MRNIIFTGVGGQGIVLASKLMAASALQDGRFVRAAETIGMAQRGGSVVSHVRYTTLPTESIASSLVPKGSADLIVSFEPGEAVRALGFLREGGMVVTAAAAQIPVTAALTEASYDGREARRYLSRELGALIVDCDAICRECGSAKVVNVALLGAAFGTGILDIGNDAFEDALVSLVKPRFLDMNRHAFRCGMELAQDASEKGSCK